MNCEECNNTGQVCGVLCPECGGDSVNRPVERLVIAGWTNTKKQQPSIVPYDDGTECGASDEVLTAYVHFSYDEVSDIEYYVERYYRGGRGDCEAEYWEIGDNRSPDYWKPIVGPFHTGQ